MTPMYVIAVAALLGAPSVLAQQSRHNGHAAHLGAPVMPFDLARSVHAFTPTLDGGTQDVKSRDGDAGQIALIRDHLRKEALAFASGDYAEPAAGHGQGMPGLAELQADASRVRVLFEETRNGARMRFSTQDPALVAALHRWFEAQVRDHGADAVMQR